MRTIHSRTVQTFIAALFIVSAGAARADWPQYRADAARSGYTAEELPTKLAALWVRQARHAPRPAWVGRSLARSRMRFDWAHTTVVSGGLCVFGSSADDQIHALDAATGREKWRFFTGGPVRLAPAVWDGRVYAVSDDGYLYCLSAADGRQLWKLRAGPSGEMVIGNGRMVSRWVARGGVAIRDGVVYFGAGIWPIEGVYVYAVDARSGKVIWCNDHTGVLEIDQPHMVCFSRGGVAAQGYVAVTKDHVLVATGRSVPAAFDRKTGAFIHFHLSRYGGKTPWGTGGGDVVATDTVFFNSGMGFDVATGLRYHNVGRRYWWDPLKRDGRKLHGEFRLGERQQIVVTPDGFVRSEGPAVFGSKLTRKTYNARREADTARATPRLAFVKMADSKRHLERIDNAPVLRDLWSVKVPSQPQSLLVAGRHVVLGADQRLDLLDSASRETVWSTRVDGMVHALAVSSGRLYACTDRGTIYCFGPADNGSGKTIAPRAKLSPYAADGPAGKAAEEIIRRSGITKGFCLDLDCGDGALAYELARRTELNVVAISSDADQVAAARAKLDAAGVYGRRVAVLQADVSDLSDYFANLVVSSKSVPHDRIARVVRPYGGTVCTGRPGAMKRTVRGELAGGGNWTHNFADAGNTMDSGDTVVKGPLGMLWYQDETQVTIDRHGKNPAPLAYKGVLLREGIDTVKAIDAYNGTQLWERDLSGVLKAYREGTQVGGGQIGSTYCVADDVVYVRKGNSCIRLDVRTGKKLGELKAPTFPQGKVGRWGYVACRDGILYGALMNDRYVIKSQHGDGGQRMQSPMDNHLTESSLLFAMDARTGKRKWTFAPKHSIRNNAIAVGAGLVYVIDRSPAEIDKILKPIVKQRRRGKGSAPEHPTGVLLALEAETGKVKWRDEKDVFGTVLAVSTARDVLLMSYGRIGFARPSDWPQGMRAYRASDGRRLWQTRQSATRPTIVDRTIYTFPYAMDLLTGEQKLIASAQPGRQKGTPWRIAGKGQGCGLVAGSKNLLLIRSGAIGYYDLAYDRGWLENYGGIRSGCFLNYLPVGGLVLVPDDTRACRCSYQNQATIALKRHGVRPPDIDPQVGQTNFRFGRHAKEPAFTGRLTITISHELDDVEIRYTLDNTCPTPESPLYTKPVTLTRTTGVRASVFRNGQKLAVRDVVVFTKVDDLNTADKKRTRTRKSSKR